MTCQDIVNGLILWFVLGSMFSLLGAVFPPKPSKYGPLNPRPKPKPMARYTWKEELIPFYRLFKR